MRKQFISTYEEFAADDQRRRLLIEENFVLEVTEKICEYMKREDISRADLARRLGVTNGYVTQILSGRKNISLRTLARVTDALGYEPRLKFQAREQQKTTQFEIQTTWESVERHAADAPSPNINMKGPKPKSSLNIQFRQVA